MKFGLKRLGLPDPYIIPSAFDPYSSVFWMDYRDVSNNGPGFTRKFEGRQPFTWPGPRRISTVGILPCRWPRKSYPLSWEIHPEGKPPYGMGIISPEFLDRRIVAPQARHAAEMLLYFLDHSAPSMRPESQEDQFHHAH